MSPLSAQVIEYEAVEVGADRFDIGGERSLFLSGNVPALAWDLSLDDLSLTDVTPGASYLSYTAADAPMFAQVPVPRLSVPHGSMRYGPFRVLDTGRAALVDATDARSPGQFETMLREHPGIATIEMIDCPGTEDDLANLRLGRLIRERGLATHVPAGGSVRSGGVELFLAGARRMADPGAEFAVHSWQDVTGLEPSDYAAGAPENRRYLDYYRQMGFSPIEAEAFYAMTNAVPFSSARWFGAGEMSLWVRFERAGA